MNTRMPCLMMMTLGFLAGCDKKEPAPAAAPAPSSAPQAAASVAPAAPQSPLHVVARLGSADPAIQGVGPFVLLYHGKLLFRATPDGIHQDPSLAAGLRPYFSWTALEAMGEWPDRGFAVLRARGTDGGYHDNGANPAGADAPDRPVFRMSKGAWGYSNLTNKKESLIGIARWSDDRYLGATILESADDWRIFLASGKATVPPYPSAPKAEKEAGAAEPVVAAEAGSPADAAAAPSAAAEPSETPTTAGGCKTNLLPSPNRSAFAPLPTGHIFVLGADCRTEARPLAVERWEPGSRKSTLEMLPDPGETPVAANYGLLAVSGSEVYVFRTGDKGKSYLVKFDGKEWKGDSVPVQGATIKAMLASENGTLWALSDGQLHAREAGQPWSKVVLPQVDGAVPKLGSIALTGKDNLWALASSPSVLLGPASPKQVLKLPERDEINKMIEPKGGVDGYFLATAVCESYYVPLQAGVTEGGKYPEVEKALKGQSGLDGAEYVIDNRMPAGLVLGAKVPDAKVGARMVDLMKAANPKSIAQLTCNAPKVKKTVVLE